MTLNAVNDVDWCDTTMHDANYNIEKAKEDCDYVLHYIMDCIFNLGKIGGAQHKEHDIKQWLGKWKGPETLSLVHPLIGVEAWLGDCNRAFIPYVGFWVIDMAPLDGLWSPLPDMPRPTLASQLGHVGRLVVGGQTQVCASSKKFYQDKMVAYILLRFNS